MTTAFAQRQTPFQLAEPAMLLQPRRPVRRVLVPTDFSEESLKPLGLAAEIVKAAGAEMHFLYVDALGTSEPEHHDFPQEEDIESAWWQAAPTKLHTVAGASSFRPNIICAVERSVEIAPAISRYAYDHHIDLIVMATSARKGFARLFLGSVAEEVVRHAPCSVLVAHDEAIGHTLSDPPRILSAIDFSETSLEAARLANQLSKALGAELSVLHAVEQPVAPAFYGVDYVVPNDFLSGVIEKSKKEIKKFANDELDDATTEVCVGSPTRTILQSIKSHDADLVVVGSHGLTGLPRFLLGSVPEKLVRLSPVPVLVVRPAAEAGELE